jgi:hypothetical protein
LNEGLEEGNVVVSVSVKGGEELGFGTLVHF